MSKQEKKRQRIYDMLNAETKPKKFRKYWSFFYGPHQAKILNPLIMLYGAF